VVEDLRALIEAGKALDTARLVDPDIKISDLP
jgi:hypothetical protein